MNVDECQIDTVVERLQTFHAVESMNNIRNVFRRQRVANELVNRICIVSDEYFRLFLLHQKIPSMDLALKMRSDPVGTEIEGSLANLCLDK